MKIGAIVQSAIIGLNVFAFSVYSGHYAPFSTASHLYTSGPYSGTWQSITINATSGSDVMYFPIDGSKTTEYVMAFLSENVANPYSNIAQSYSISVSKYTGTSGVVGVTFTIPNRWNITFYKDNDKSDVIVWGGQTIKLLSTASGDEIRYFDYVVATIVKYCFTVFYGTTSLTITPVSGCTDGSRFNISYQ